jgi:hypothetical protein
MLGQIPDLAAPARGFYDVSKYVAMKFPMKRRKAEHAKLKKIESHLNQFKTVCIDYQVDKVPYRRVACFGHMPAACLHLLCGRAPAAVRSVDPSMECG